MSRIRRGTTTDEGKKQVIFFNIKDGRNKVRGPFHMIMIFKKVQGDKKKSHVCQHKN